MSDLFPNQSYGMKTLRHTRLPIIITEEFDFFRCVVFNDKFYGKTVSELHSGNLRTNSRYNRKRKKQCRANDCACKSRLATGGLK